MFHYRKTTQYGLCTFADPLGVKRSVRLYPPGCAPEMRYWWDERPSFDELLLAAGGKAKDQISLADFDPDA